MRFGDRDAALWITDAELDARPELVRTMSVAPPRGEGRVRLLEIPGIDLQACGGTHVANTAEIGALKVVRIRSEGKRNKRVTLVAAHEPQSSVVAAWTRWWTTSPAAAAGSTSR